MCGREPTGPRVGEVTGIARFVLQPDLGDKGPLFQAAGLQVDRIHIVIRGADGNIVFERDVVFPAGQNEVSITADVPVHGETERFRASYELFSGTTPMFTGTVEVTGKPGTTTTTPSVVPTTFVGPGATATRVDVTPASQTLVAAATTTLTATAFDNANAAIVGTPFVWSSSNPAIASVSPTGIVTSGTTRGAATISASTISGVTGSATVNVTLPAARIVIVSGDNQTGRAGQTLAAPIVFEVQASDGVAIPNAAMVFAAVTGGGSVSSVNATSAGTGRASMTATLGGTLGAQTFRATTGAFTATATATATPGLPAQIVIVSGNAQSDSIGRVLAQPLVVKATDAFGNATPGVTIGWARTAGSGATSASTSLTDAGGLTQMTYTLGAQPGTETIAATLPAPSSASVNFTATAIPRQAASLTVVSGSGQSGTVGKAAQPLVVLVRDALGNPVSGATVEWTLAGGGALGAATSVTNAQGQAQVAFTFDNMPGGATVTARLASNASVFVLFSLNAVVGPVATLQIEAGNGQSAAGGASVPIAPAVSALDALGNPVAGLPVTFTPSAGSSVTGSPATTNASGIATVGSWTLGATAGPYSLVASAGSVSAAFTATATAPVGPSTLSITTQPSGAVQNTVVFPQQPSIQLKNAAGANLATAGVAVTVSLQTPGPTLRGVLTVNTNASGVATFTNLSVLGAVGSNALVFSAPTFTGVTSGTINIAAGPAVYLIATTATALTGTAGAVVAPNPTVVVKDSSMNVVAGASVVFAPFAGGNGVVSGGGTTTNGSGVASPASWTLDAVVGADTVTATSGALVGSPVLFVATTSAGAATQVAIVSGDNQTGITGNPLAAPMIAIAKDALNNPVSGINLGFSVTAGGGTPASLIIATNAGGQASFTLTLGPPGTQTVQVCLPGCAATTSFTALSIPVGANAIWTGATSTDWSVGSNWSPAVVPNSSNSVFIPTGTPNAPALTATSNVGDLTMASGATLNVGAFNLNVSGNVNSTGAVLSGAGYFYFCGGTHSVIGTTAGLVADCGSTVNAGGVVAIGPGLSVFNSSIFAVNAADVTVTGNMDVFSGSRVQMVTAGGHLLITGNLNHTPNNDIGDTWLTDGVLEVQGNLSGQFSGPGQSFRAVGNHITRFSGAGAQAINFQFSHEGYHRETFGRLEFTGGNTVTLNNHVRVLGSVTVNNNTVVTSPGGYAILHQGQLTTTAGTNLSGIGYTQLDAGGAIFPLIAGTPPPVVHLNNNVTVTLPNASVTLPTSLQTNNSVVLDLEAKQLIVAGNFQMNSSSRVKMTQSAAHFLVNGNYTSIPNNDVGDTWMTDGILEVRGNLTGQFSGPGQSFRAVGNHLTRFSGSGAQAINFQFSHEGYHRETFGRLEFTGGNTVTLSNHVRVFGTVVVNNNTTITSPGSYAILHQGQLTTTAGTNLSGMGYTQLDAGGAIFPLIAGTPPPVVHLNNNVTVTLPNASVTLPTSLQTHNGAVLDLQNKSLTVSGNFQMNSGSRVKMTDPAAFFLVTGNYTSLPSGDVGDTWMTDGILEVRGNFTGQFASAGQTFRAVGNHLTRFSGSGAQSINFQFSHEGYHRETFGKLEFTGGNTVTLSNHVRVFGTVVVNNNTTITGGGYAILHQGQLTTTAGTNLSGIGYTQLDAGGAIFPLIAGTPPPVVHLNNSVTVTLPSASVTLPTNLQTHNSAVLDLQNKSLTVSGNFQMNSGSRVKMTDPAAFFLVTGNYTSLPSGDVGDTWMTDGILEVRGNFTGQFASAGQTFRAVGNHLTRFSGSGAQSINFQFSHEGHHRETFGRLEFTGNNTVTLLNNVRTFGSVTVTGTTAVVGAGGIIHYGQLSTAAGTSLSGLGYTQLEGSGAIFPVILGSGPGTVHISNGGVVVTLPQASVTLPTNLQTHNSAVLEIADKELIVTGNFQMNSSSRVKMVNAAGHFQVNGSYVSAPGNDVGDTWMTDGLLEVKGNFAGQFSGPGQSFRALGNHITRLSGTGAQSISFQYAHEGPHRETFGKLEITNASGVATNGGVQVLNSLTNTGSFTIGSGHLVNVGGTLFLGPSSSTVNNGSLTKASCVVMSGTPTISGFTCTP